MELWIASLIVVPVVAALLLLAIKNDRARDMVAIAFAALYRGCFDCVRGCVRGAWHL